jgi:F-type H+-transporting ATPase subunit gamma
MDRADRNIDEMLVTLHDSLHRQRQARIDEELSDVISGFKALSNSSRSPVHQPK